MDILKPFTTATAAGVAVRYITAILGGVLAILGVFGFLTPEQQQELTAKIPEIASAAGALISVAIVIYATLTKSSSDKAAEAAKEIDAKVPAKDPVLIKTPGGAPDIVVPAK